MSGKQGMVHYSKAVKMMAVEMKGQGKTNKEIAQELQLPRAELVKQWLKRYRKEGISGFEKPIGRPKKQPLTQEAYIARLEMENTLLKKFHTELQRDMLVRRNIGSLNTTEGSIH
jgi:transposase